jgi:hypothetical protein
MLTVASVAHPATTPRSTRRLLLACAASVLHHALRTHTLQHTALANAQPSTVMLTLFKVATQIQQYKDQDPPPPPQFLPCQGALTPCRAIQFSNAIPMRASACAGWAANRRHAAAMLV